MQLRGLLRPASTSYCPGGATAVAVSTGAAWKFGVPSVHGFAAMTANAAPSGQSADAQPAESPLPPGTIELTAAQLDSFKIEPVAMHACPL
jgi:hypothetical protein